MNNKEVLQGQEAEEFLCQDGQLNIIGNLEKMDFLLEADGREKKKKKKTNHKCRCWSKLNSPHLSLSEPRKWKKKESIPVQDLRQAIKKIFLSDENKNHKHANDNQENVEGKIKTSFSEGED